MTARNRVTIRDVAASVGVTPMTVSNVVNGRRQEVGQETYDRVMEACRRLGYRPHANARRLRTDRRQAIGVVLFAPDQNYLADPFTAALLAGLNDSLSPQGYSIVLHGALPGNVEEIPLLQRIETDAICAFLSGSIETRRSLTQRLLDLRQPLALIQEELSALQDIDLETDDVCAVLQDDFGGGVMVARHVLDGKSQHIAMLVPTVEWPAMVSREAGFRSVLDRMPSPPRFHVVPCGDESFAATQDALKKHIKQHGIPDVVFGGNDQMAIAGMQLLARRDLKIPQDVRVVGFNGFEFWRYCTPQLTTVRSPAYELGRSAGSAMLRRLDEGHFPFKQQTLPVEFAPNGSSCVG